MSPQYGDSYNDPYSRQQQHVDRGYVDNPAQQDQAYGYLDNPYGEAPRYPTYPSDPSAGDYLNASSTEKIAEESQLEHQDTQRAQPGRSGLAKPPTTSFAEMGPPPRSTGILRVWRKDERGKQWSRGGGVRMSLRFCCCCFTIAIIMIISIILAIVLYVRPPSVALNSVSLGSNPVSLALNGFTVSFDLSISVSNPNWFDANFKEITAKARYPGNNANSFGGGTLYGLNFKGYTLAKDPNKVILNDLMSKCGITGGSVRDITVDYDLHLKLKFLGLIISPTVSNSASFKCPITEKDIESIIGSST
ncbi:uncharacterized protein L203_101991 [Cryptococcus depauperatus CBS 7841]|uniref:Late embryogenesis abundant protein LEA-2 subgroup domain-containing protein n=1 Tax=Cryptococcus depauperatus CBS 7841 TaxID=1295531 RepID=A0AAJ8M0A0_9TREE